MRPYQLRGPRSGQLLDTPDEVSQLAPPGTRIRLDSKALSWITTNVQSQNRRFGFGPRSARGWDEALFQAMLQLWIQAKPAETPGCEARIARRQLWTRVCSDIRARMETLPEKPFKYAKAS